MRVLLYSSSAHWSGGARVFATAASGLVDRGYQVTFACRAGGAVEERLPFDRYTVLPLPMIGTPVARSARLRRELADHFVEVVLVHTEREALVASMAARLAGRAAVVRRVPAGGTPEQGLESRIAERLAATGYLYTSEDDGGDHRPHGALETVAGELGVSIEELDAIEPVTVARDEPSADARVLACVVDGTAPRRAALVLRTVALLAPRHPELEVLLVGSGADDPELRMHAAALGLSGVVHSLGERDDQRAILKAADLVWVVAGGDEAALGFLDAMGMRVPVLAERGPLAQRYVVDGSTGTLLSPGEHELAAARVATLLRDPERRVAMGSAARARVARDFTERAMVDAFERAVRIARDRARWLA